MLYLDGNIWIANEDIDGVAVVDVSTGLINDIVSAHRPVWLHYDKNSNLIFVSSRKKHWEGCVYAIDPVKKKVVSSYSNNRMDHPSGMTTHGDVLYVALNDLGDVLTFNITSTKFLKTLLSDFMGEIEQIIMTDC